MSHNNIEQRRFELQTSFLTSLQPKYVSLDDLHKLFDSLKPLTPDADAPLRFNNFALLDSDDCRSEVLLQVNTILEKYAGDTLAKTTQEQLSNPQVEKDLLWAGLQLFAYLQAIEQEVGLIQNSKTEYNESLGKLEICQALLYKNGSDFSKISALLRDKPVVADAISGQWYEKAFNDFIAYIDARNNTRLFWVWGRPNLDLALEYAGQAEARARLANTTYVPGEISWSLYLFRGSFFAIAMFNKWWNNPAWLKKLKEAGLSDAEYAEYRAQYLIAYWNVYKYRILNDYVWGPINFGSFEWWVGNGFPGWFGDFATCFLLCMDIYLADLLYQEEEKKYQTIQAQYVKNRETLSLHIVQSIHNGVKKNLMLKNKNFDRIPVTEQMILLDEYLEDKKDQKTSWSNHEIELSDLLRAWREGEQDQKNHTQRWQKKEKFLWYDRVYTKALLFVFAMAVAFLVGGLLPTALAVILTKSGTILCLALTILYRTVRAQLEIKQSQEERTELQNREAALFKEFLTLKGQYSAENIDEKALKKMHNLYLSLVKTGAQIDYQTASIQYQYLELARTTLMRFSIPTLLGLTLIYAPATVYMIPTYVFVLIASAAFAYVLDRWAKQYKPDEVQAPKFDAAQYQTFFATPRVYSQAVEESCFSLPKRPSLGGMANNV